MLKGKVIGNIVSTNKLDKLIGYKFLEIQVIEKNELTDKFIVAVDRTVSAGIGEVVRVHRINGVGALQRRMMDLGLLNGTEIFVRKVAPLGDPMAINVRGYELSLRKSEADVIVIE